MKKSLAAVPRRSNPVRISNAVRGDGSVGGRPSTRPSQGPSRSVDAKSNIPSLIPHPKVRGVSTDRTASTGRSASTDRNSRSTAVDLSSRKSRRSKSLASQQGTVAATPKYQTTQQHQLLSAHYSGQSYRSRSNERVFPGQNGRFSSLGGGAKKPDSRPINDKSFQANAMRRVYSFFQKQPGNIANLCPEPGNKSIMIRSFVEMMSFLLNEFVPGTALYVSNYVVEIPVIMKKIGYPGNVTSSWLKTANVPHAWPHVVSMLSWLVDLLNYDEAGDDLEKFFPMDYEGLVDPKTFFDFTLDSFVAWNNADESACAGLDEKLVQFLRDEQGCTTKELKAVQSAVAKLEAELDDPEEMAAINNFKDLEGKYVKMCAKEKSIVESINRDNLRSSKVLEDIEAIKWQQKSRAQQYETAMKERDQLEHTVASQVLSCSDAEKIESKCNDLKVQISNQDQYKQNMVKVLYSIELKVSRAQSALNKVCVEYNTDILGCSFEAADHLQLELAYNRPDIQESWQKIEDSLADLHSSIKEKLTNSQDQLTCTAKQASQMEEQKRSMKNEIRKLVAKHNDLNQLVNNQKLNMQRTEENLKKQKADTEAKCTTLLAAMPDMESVQIQLKEAEERRARLKKECKWVQERGISYLTELQDQMVKNRNDLFEAFGIPVPEGVK